jgi:UDP-glucuronate 4-epimerase
MANERFLVTGALGCIGAWVVRNLIREGVPTAIFDLASDPRRLRLIMSEEEMASSTILSASPPKAIVNILMALAPEP